MPPLRRLARVLPPRVRRSAAWQRSRTCYDTGQALVGASILLLTPRRATRAAPPPDETLRILVHEAGLSRASTGGAERSLLAVADELATRGHDVVLPTAERALHGPSELSRRRLREHYRWADIVLTQKRTVGTALRWGARYGVPVVHFIRGPGQLPPYGRPALVVFNAEWLRNAEDWPGRTCVLYPPVFPERYAVTPGHAVTLVNLAEFKGATVFYALARRLPDRRFIGVRGNWGTQLVPSDLPPNVEIVENTPDIRTVYARTRILLMPSEEEPFGRVGLEAAASGIPTVAHPCAGLREALGPAGIYVDRDDVDGWVRVVQALDDEGEYARRSELARAQSARLHPRRLVAEFEEELRTAIAVRPTLAARSTDEAGT